jgi:hypothetical protein
MAEPIQISVELQEMKADVRKNNKKARVAGEGSKKLGDVTCTYNGLFLGGGLPEEIKAVADRAKEEARKKALRAEDTEVLRKVREIKDAKEARRRIEDGGAPKRTPNES